MGFQVIEVLGSSNGTTLQGSYLKKIRQIKTFSDLNSIFKFQNLRNYLNVSNSKNKYIE